MDSFREVDLVNRDPNDLNSHVKVSFEDVIAEPDSSHSLDCVWTCSHSVFECSKGCWYKFLTLCFSLPISFFWGIEFAYITFDHVWQFTPALRVFSIHCGSAQKFFTVCLQCCLGPICETCGLFFSQITVKNS
ncbi:hypothetical protein BaRGS_00012560 [Batillaria attramentaria]|uniref:Caveolin n=1 Tax=Batillaria attramentaria TaxID=370345 RepID=A0ABD0LAA8_9CAEN